MNGPAAPPFTPIDSRSHRYYRSVIQRIPALIVAITLALVASTLSMRPAEAVNADGDITVRVLVINLDPIIEAKANQRLHTAYAWRDPRTLANDYLKTVGTVATGRAHYEIVSWKDVDLFPKKKDGFQYTDATYMTAIANNTFNTVPADYPALLSQTGAITAINGNTADEVWFFGGPGFGLWQSAMAGPGAYAIKEAPAYTTVATTKPFVSMGFDYKQKTTEMLFNLCRRTEAAMTRTYGGWHQYALENPTLWDSFTASNIYWGLVEPFGVGECSVPHNAMWPNQYDNYSPERTTAEDWLKFPNLTGADKWLSASAWKKTSDLKYDYLVWWFTRLPHDSGTNADGKLNNWWRYVFKFSSPTSGNIQAPPAPSSVSAKAITATQIKVTWRDTGNFESGFEVNDGTTSWKTAANATSYTIGGLTLGAKKCVRVRAFNASGSSAWAPAAPTNTVCATIPTTVPNAPTGVAAAGISTSQVKVTWTDTSSNEAGFRITDGTTTWSAGANTTSYTISNLAPSTKKCVRVQSQNAVGASAWVPADPNLVCATTLALQPPAAPSGVSTKRIFNAAQIAVSWTDVATNETSYQLVDELGTVWSANQNTTTFLLNSVPGGPRCFRVRARNADGYSAWVPAAPAFACAPMPTSVPATPTNVVATAASTSSIKVSWTDVASNEVWYQIWDSTGKQIGYTQAGATTYTVTGLASKTRYCYQIASTNELGSSPRVPAAPGYACATTL